MFSIGYWIDWNKFFFNCLRNLLDYPSTSKAISDFILLTLNPFTSLISILQHLCVKVFRFHPSTIWETLLINQQSEKFFTISLKETLFHHRLVSHFDYPIFCGIRIKIALFSSSIIGILLSLFEFFFHHQLFIITFYLLDNFFPT